MLVQLFDGFTLKEKQGPVIIGTIMGTQEISMTSLNMEYVILSFFGFVPVLVLYNNTYNIRFSSSQFYKL